MRLRAEAQRARFKLPHGRDDDYRFRFRKTTIRGLRPPDFKRATSTRKDNYRTIAEHIKQAIIEQERLGLDVLVRRKPSMVELRRASGRLRLYPEMVGCKAMAPAV